MWPYISNSHPYLECQHICNRSHVHVLNPAADSGECRHPQFSSETYGVYSWARRGESEEDLSYASSACSPQAPNLGSLDSDEMRTWQTQPSCTLGYNNISVYNRLFPVCGLEQHSDTTLGPRHPALNTQSREQSNETFCWTCPGSESMQCILQRHHFQLQKRVNLMQSYHQEHNEYKQVVKPTSAMKLKWSFLGWGRGREARQRFNKQASAMHTKQHQTLFILAIKILCRLSNTLATISPLLIFVSSTEKNAISMAKQPVTVRILLWSVCWHSKTSHTRRGLSHIYQMVTRWIPEQWNQIFSSQQWNSGSRFDSAHLLCSTFQTMEVNVVIPFASRSFILLRAKIGQQHEPETSTGK